MYAEVAFCSSVTSRMPSAAICGGARRLVCWRAAGIVKVGSL